MRYFRTMHYSSSLDKCPDEEVCRSLQRKIFWCGGGAGGEGYVGASFQEEIFHGEREFP